MDLKTLLYIFLLTAVIIGGGVLLIPFRSPAGFLGWLFLTAGGLFLLVRWHARNTAYICPKCGHFFMISAMEDFLSPHMIDQKLLKCPKCGKRSWCQAVSAKARSLRNASKDD
ncbi:MAG: hypothetical protein QHH75_01265 [Bacillota bacterium]|jgi:predicted RNA-binding Zn-ribbon protein involved in translation (DUF1610 family)|nr:hypothetical protein [Bacillota bacterium]